jgi:hypothetical protein
LEHPTPAPSSQVKVTVVLAVCHVAGTSSVTLGAVASRVNVISLLALFHALSVTVNLITNVQAVSEEIVVAIVLAEPKVIVPVPETLVQAYVATQATSAFTTPVCVKIAFLV